MSYRIKMHLPEEFIEEVPQNRYLNMPAPERLDYFIYPVYVYDPEETPMDVTDSNFEVVCWSIKDPLLTWLRDQGLNHNHVVIDMTTKMRGWVIYLPKDVAMLYKLTWL